jgi:hypothetical protein
MCFSLADALRRMIWRKDGTFCQVSFEEEQRCETCDYKIRKMSQDIRT